MPVRRFRTIEDMKRPTWREPGDPELFRAIAGLWEFGARSGHHRFPPGVYKNRTIEAMNRRTEGWRRDNFVRLQRGRGTERRD